MNKLIIYSFALTLTTLINPLLKASEASENAHQGNFVADSHMASAPEENSREIILEQAQNTISHFKSIAEKDNDKEALFSLGKFYRDNVLEITSSQSYAEAIYWFRLAAAQGEVLALHEAGVMYQSLKFKIPKLDSYKEAIKYFERAVLKGHQDSKWELGKTYLAIHSELFNNELKQSGKRYYDLGSLNSAIYWFKQLADTGDSEACYELGIIYKHYKCGILDELADKEADKWFTLAAAYKQ